MEGFRVVVCPEYATPPTTEIESFYATISLTYEDATKDSTKVLSNYLFIMDTSGSMDGEKIANLKNSILCVLPMLTHQDRLALIYFNSSAEILSHLEFMTEPNKKLVRDCVFTLKASGGTSILAGLRKGLSLLQSQGNGLNNWCVFLLTDGQDREDVHKQYEIAAEIQRCGAELFIFGFGSDHDNVHLATLATKSNTVFAFIDTDQHIRDYFSASVGLHQSCSLKNVQLFVEILCDGVCLQELKAGSYEVSFNENSSSVLFPDIKNGEERYILVRLNLPAVSSPVEKYGLFTAQATYTIKDGRQISSTNFTEKLTCFVDRIEQAGTGSERNINQTRSLAVDTEINAQEAAKAMQEAIQAADIKNTSHAETVITNATEQIKQSISFESHEIKSVLLVQDLEESKVIVSTPSKYEAGGRAQMSDALSQIRLQRCICPQKGKTGIFQTKSAAEAQKAAEYFSVQLSGSAGIIAEFDSLLDAATARYDYEQQLMLSLQERLKDFEGRARNLFNDASFQNFWKDYIKQLFREGNSMPSPDSPLGCFAIAAEPSPTSCGVFSLAAKPEPIGFGGYAIAAEPAPAAFGGFAIPEIPASFCAPSLFCAAPVAVQPSSGSTSLFGSSFAASSFCSEPVTAQPSFGSTSSFRSICEPMFGGSSSAPVSVQPSFGSAAPFASSHEAMFSGSCSPPVAVQPAFGSPFAFGSSCEKKPYAWPGWPEFCIIVWFCTCCSFLNIWFHTCCNAIFFCCSFL